MRRIWLTTAVSVATSATLGFAAISLAQAETSSGSVELCAGQVPTIVGDGYAEGDARGAAPDILVGGSGDDRIVGDNRGLNSEKGQARDELLDGRAGSDSCESTPGDNVKRCEE